MNGYPPCKMFVIYYNIIYRMRGEYAYSLFREKHRPLIIKILLSGKA